MAQTVASHAVAAFTDPQNGQSPVDADQVTANDNALRVGYVAHDADTGIHLQSSALGSRPAFGTAGRKWLSADASSYRLWFDTGSAWEELTYLRSDAGGTVAGNITVSSGGITVTGNSTITGTLGSITQLNVDNLRIDGNTLSATTGAVNIDPVAGSAIVLDGTINVDAGVVTGATSITSTAFVGTLSTAAQPNVTSLGALTSLRVTATTKPYTVGLIDTATLLTATLTGSGTGDTMATAMVEPNFTAAGDFNWGIGLYIKGFAFAPAGYSDSESYGILVEPPSGAGTNWSISASGTSYLQNLQSALIGVGGVQSSTSYLALGAGTTGVSSLRIPHGSAPSSPVNGDMWTTTAGLFVQINGSTVGPLS